MSIFTRTQQRVLTLIFGSVGESFTVSDLIREARCGSGAVQREVAKLAEAGLITMTPVGNQKRYQANPAAPIFEELRRIVMKLDQRSAVSQVPRSASPSPSTARRRTEPEPDFVD